MFFMGRPLTLFRVFGIPLKLDLSWFLIAVLIVWSLATGFFPTLYPNLSKADYWTMGAIGALGLFGSIVVHELGHALTARRFGVEIRGITLFIFGGVAELADEPPSPKAEGVVAIAGPLVSIAVGVLAWVARAGALAAGWPTLAVGVLTYLGIINLVLVAFNMIPAMPLDGGRVLRAVLWAWQGSLRRATRISSAIGSTFGMLLVVLGVISVLLGDFVSGMWWFLIGLFLRQAAAGSYQQVLLRQILEGEPVERFMKAQPVTVPRSISVAELVDDYIYKYHFKSFPVVDGERLVGYVTIDEVRKLQREEWSQQTVGAIALPCSPENTIGPEEDAMQALAKMGQTRQSRLLVVDAGRVVGVLSLRDLLDFFRVKLELERA